MSNAPINYWNMQAALEQIAKCQYECEGGHLESNDAWRWLVAAAKVGPEFWPGQGVYYQVQAEAAGKTLKQWVHFFIVGCAMTSSDTKRYWTYSLSYDPPRPWHYGEIHFKGVVGSQLSLTKPDADTLSTQGKGGDA